MKTVVVVLVLFVGFNSGVIVPSVSKAIHKTKLVSNSTDTKEMNLEKSDKIHEKEVLQTSADKETSLNERSFIFINQRFKTSLRNQLYNSKAQNLNNPYKINERLPQVNVIPSTSAQENVSPSPELFNMKNIKVDSKFHNVPPTYRNQYKELKSRVKDQKFTLQRNLNVKKLADFKQLYVREKEKLEKASPDSHPQNLINPHQSNDNDQGMTSYVQPKMNYNYNFPKYIPVRIRNNEVFSMPEVQASLVTDNNGNLSPLDIPDESDKFERYIKETMKEFDVNDLADQDGLEKCPTSKTKENGGAKNGKVDSDEMKYMEDLITTLKQDPEKNGIKDYITSSENSAAPVKNDNLFAYLNVWSR